MPLAFLAAMASSLMIHAAALFLPEVDLAPAPEPMDIQAELKPVTRPMLPPAKPEKKPRPEKPRVMSSVAPGVPGDASPVVSQAPEKAQAAVEPVAPTARLPVKGRVRFAVFKGTQGLEVGRAIHEWELGEDRYRLHTLTETSGLAAIFRAIRVEQESQGKLTVHGLQPERLTTRRNGNDTKENVVFDWAAGQLQWSKDGSVRELQPGAQDLASFAYQLGYLPQLRSGLSMGVATGRKYDIYRFEVLGEVSLETAAGTFRTLHLRVPGDSVTELWLAEDHLLVPIKIRHTDRKGEIFEQIAVELTLGN